jgi:hypothetical protein
LPTRPRIRQAATANSEPIPAHFGYARLRFLFFHLRQVKGDHVLTALLLLAFVLALVAGCTPVLAVIVMGLEIHVYPVVAILVIAAITAWAINQYWR